MFFKSIFQGNLQFGNIKSYEKVIKMYDHRVENYYKNDVLFKLEEIFSEEDLTLKLPRTVVNITDKNWKNSVDLLQYVAQFAISGNIPRQHGQRFCFTKQFRSTDLRNNQCVGEALVAGFAKLLPQPLCVLGALQVSDG